MSKYDKDTKFYWLQLKEDFFEDDAMQWLEEQENGKDYCYFYLKLCLKSLKSDGILIRKVGKMLIPYDAKKLAELTNTNFDTVIVAMKLLEQIGLIEILGGGEIYLTQIEDMIGSKSKGAFKKQQQRALKNDNLLIESEKEDNCPPKRPPKIEIDREIDLELEKEIDTDEEEYSFEQMQREVEEEALIKKNQSINRFNSFLLSNPSNQSIYDFFYPSIVDEQFRELGNKYSEEVVFEKLKRLMNNLQSKGKSASKQAFTVVKKWCEEDVNKTHKANSQAYQDFNFGDKVKIGNGQEEIYW